MTASFAKGFTFIELLITVVITASLLGLVVIGYRRFLEGRRLSLAGDELKSQLRLVRSKAMSGEKPVSDCSSLNGYRVKEEGGGLVYLPVCDGSDYTAGKESFALTNEVDSIEIVDSTEFLFKAISGSLDRDGATIRLNYQGEEKELIISPSGEVD